MAFIVENGPTFYLFPSMTIGVPWYACLGPQLMGLGDAEVSSIFLELASAHSSALGSNQGRAPNFPKYFLTLHLWPFAPRLLELWVDIEYMLEYQ